MNELPRREPTPLYAEAGSFERTLRRARRRRARAAGLSMVAALAICTGGAIALVTTNTAQPEQTAEVPPNVPASITTSTVSPGPSAQPTPSDGQGTGSRPPATSGPSEGPGSSVPGSSGGSHSSGSPGKSSTSPTHSTSTSGSHPGSTPTKAYHGLAVDHQGKPLPHLTVYVVPAAGKPEPVGQTEDDGTFQAPCTGDPVLLAGKGFGPAASGDSGNPDAGYTYVGNGEQAPDCGGPTAQPAAHTTVMPEAGTIELTVTDSSGTPVPDSDQPELYCPGVGTEPCYEPLTDADGKYTFTGLSAGTYTLRSGDLTQDYTVTAGQSTQVTWTLPDESSPTPTPTPTEPSNSSGSTSDSSSSGTSTTSDSPVR